MSNNVIVGQSGGPTAVINSSLAGVYKTARSLGAGKVYGMKYGIEGLLKEEIVDLDILLDDRMSIELLKRTPSSFLGSCRYKLPDPETDSTPYIQLFTLFDKYGISAVFYIGGNDSMDTIAKLSRYGKKIGSPVRFIGVPKTIDNDLCLTDHTPGYGSAAKYIATILKEVIRDSSVYDIRSVTVAEIMGRHAGWLAGAACLAAGEDCDGPDLILLLNFQSRWIEMDSLTCINNRSSFYQEVQLRLASRQHFQVIAISLRRFSDINQHYGHENGDALLVRNARILGIIGDNVEGVIDLDLPLDDCAIGKKGVRPDNSDREQNGEHADHHRTCTEPRGDVAQGNSAEALGTAAISPLQQQRAAVAERSGEEQKGGQQHSDV